MGVLCVGYGILTLVMKKSLLSSMPAEASETGTLEDLRTA